MLGLIEPPQLCTYCSVLEVSATLLAITRRKTTYPINKREIPASGKFTKYSKCSLLAICIFLKCSLLARKIWQLLVLAKINTLLACSQTPFDTPLYQTMIPRLEWLHLLFQKRVWGFHQGFRMREKWWKHEAALNQGLILNSSLSSAMASSRFRQVKSADEEAKLVESAVPKSTPYKN